MSGFLEWLLPAGFMPHGHCYLWRTDVLWLNVGSDGLIAASYYAIPFALGWFVRRRRAVLPYWWVPMLFAAFISLCGTTHVLGIWTVWHPDYVIDGLVKAATGLVSAATAVLVFAALPRALALRTPIELQREVDARTAELLTANARLREEIAAREQSDAALLASETRCRAIFDHAAIGLALLTPDGHWLKVNPTVCRLLGYSEEELLRRTFADITHPDDVARDWQETQRLLAGEIDSFTVEKRYLCKGGAVIWALVEAALMRDERGQPAYFVAAIADISERRNATAAMKEQEQRMRLALEASGAATWLIDYADQRTEHFDSRSRELAGLDPERSDWPEGTFCSLLHPEDRARMREVSEQTHAYPGPGALIEYRIVRSDGQVRWLQGAGIVERSADGSPRQFVGVSIDISERKSLEAQLRQTITKLADADRRKDQFLATLAHELRNPLAPISNGVQIMKLAARGDERLKHTTEMMERQMQHLTRLVDDLLDVNRITRGKIPMRRERLALKEVLRDTLEASTVAIEAKRLELTVDAPEESLIVQGDRDRLTQVFSNILSNAIKYTPAGGRIAISCARAGQEAVIGIRDTGVGIPAEALESVFELFSQLQPSGRGEGGLGIGLALVRQLVQLQGGRVEARSEGLGCGSEFLVYLPVLPVAAVAGSAAPPVTAVPSAARRLLVVDDNVDAAQTLAALLRMMGHEVKEATSGQQAIELARTIRPEVIFMDIGMPGMDGLAATRQIRSLSLDPQPVIIALTGWGQDGDRERSQEAGIDQHLIKPIEFETLARVLGQLTPASRTQPEPVNRSGP